MRYFALITPQCLEDAATNGFQSEIQALVAKVERDQSIGTWDKFLRTPFVKKALGTFRVVAEERPIGDDAVVCLRHVFARGSSPYRRFMEDPHSIGQSPSDDELRTWLAERKTVAPTKLPGPSDGELRYLYLTDHDQFDEFVYETAEWVERIARIDARAIPWLHQLLADRVLVDGDGAETFVTANQTGVLFRRFPELHRTVLVAPLFGSSLRDEQELRRRFEVLLSTTGLTDIDLRQRSRRAYPTVVLAD